MLYIVSQNINLHRFRLIFALIPCYCPLQVSHPSKVLTSRCI
nr:MAG TPA: hypothetical protein [Caudoviricetes sp.]